MGTAREYIIEGFFPNEMELRMELTCYDDRDAMAVAQGLLKVTTLRSCYVVDAADGHKVFECHMDGTKDTWPWDSCRDCQYYQEDEPEGTACCQYPDMPPCKE